MSACGSQKLDRVGFANAHALPVAIVFDPGIDVCIERNKARPDRAFGGQVVQRMVSEVRRGLGGLQRKASAKSEACQRREHRSLRSHTPAPWTDKRDDHGPSISSATFMAVRMNSKFFSPNSAIALNGLMTAMIGRLQS